MSEHHHNLSGKNLLITIILNIIITISQIIGGILSGSLALLSDAMHNFSDILALVIAYIANHLMLQEHTQAKTFGYKRAEILATLFNASILIGIAIFLMVESFHKFYHPEPINSLWVIGLGVLSIILNAISVLLIKDDTHNNMNMQAAYLHLLTDVMTSIAVVGGGILMYYFGFFWIDPLISALIAFYLIWASFGLVKESSAILMQFTPAEINVNTVVDSIQEEPEIKNIHHLHIWKLNDHQINLEAHLDFNEDVPLSVANKVSQRISTKLHNIFNIEHITFQCEYDKDDNKAIIK